MPKKISQSQIAGELGVSQSLVSIVLNGRKEGISPKTCEKIWNYALKHGYLPKGMKLPPGAGLGEEPMLSVGYFLRAPLGLANMGNFFNQVAQGIYEYLRGQQMNLVFLGSELDITVKELCSSTWRKKPLTGIVIMGEVQQKFLTAVRDLNRPLVYLGTRSPGSCHSVNANAYQAAEQLVDHLHALGHRHFAFLGGMRARSRNDERLQGLIRSLDRYKVKLPNTATLILEDAGRKQGYLLSEQLLRARLDPFPTAWICTNGLLARGVLSKLFLEGIRVGHDVSVAAFDNTRVCSEELPGITSASSLPEDLGREAGRILLNPDLHGDDSLLDVVLPSKFTVRESTGPAPDQSSDRIRTLLAVH